jgi:dCMP deaminase
MAGAWLALSAGALVAVVYATRRRAASWRHWRTSDPQTDAEWLRLLNNTRSLTSHRSAVSGQCAAVIVRDGRILSWGWARSLVRAKRPGKRASDRTDLHAEADAITAAARNGISLDGATLYCTIMCCRSCFALVTGAGITRVVTPPAVNHGYQVMHGEVNAEIADLYGMEVCDDAVLPPYEKVPDDSFLPALKRREATQCSAR